MVYIMFTTYLHTTDYFSLLSETSQALNKGIWEGKELFGSMASCCV